MRGQWRRTKCAGLAVAGALTLTATMGSSAPAANAQAAPFNNGTGSAFAESMRLDPVAGGLSFGVGIGQALAGHQNTVASADSRALNLGVIGVTPTPYGGKWAHEDTRRSAKIAGAHIVEDVDLSQSSLEVDVLTDEQVLSAARQALAALVAAEPALVA